MGLPSGAHTMGSLDITADAALVVATAYVQVDPGVLFSRARVWSPQCGWEEFGDWLAAQDISFPGWTFRTLQCVSPDGLTFAGQGVTPSGDVRGFVVTIPGPGRALRCSWAGRSRPRGGASETRRTSGE